MEKKQTKINFDMKISSFYSSSNFFLNSLFDLYGSDKGTNNMTLAKPYVWNSHTYGDYYSRLFDHCVENISNVFECGLGTNDTNIPSNMGKHGKPGASLRAWRDYFPKANIYGGDIDKNILFEEERIKTFYVDQMKRETIKNLWDQINIDNFDLIIEDGLHTFEAAINFFEMSIDRLSDNGIYIIEDVQTSEFSDFAKYFELKKIYTVNFIILQNTKMQKTNSNLIEIRKINKKN